ncbi:tricarballylate utilization 4Fe-4S protein TcuB [Leisingera sp. M658]|uniref:tricarballylate utilization 4Fe-4S protein TcuB n=1 Tax=Leisingera sp. M658 TaxID=2867015 RepID=UPI0021A8E849|nr:tricarballylate utilization 4Fe-4S protein TcuB [Leisingera sp. M658]UWQ73993.1 tricarballylate utilization 4Fe-4S protein TcuB [Leisingera sp. M658]
MFEQSQMERKAAARIDEARRQIEICNACRYCEGYCSVFPAIMRQRSFADADVTQFANLCHNCRGCYYACQYTEPHEFDLNLPGILAEVRTESWERFAWPSPLARLFQRSGTALAVALMLGFAVLFWAAQTLRPESGEGFYAVMSHGLMVSVFMPAFLLPLLALFVSLRRYWRHVGGQGVGRSQIRQALSRAAYMKDLSGGQGQGCNFEDEDRFSNARRYAHQAVVWGVFMCFGSTISGTIMHYVFDWPAPYGLLSLPKLLGVPGGLLLTAGCLELARLKLKAEPALGARRVWAGEMGFVLLLGFVSLSGLLLYASAGTAAVAVLLPLHLGAVLTFFLLMPYTKMAHGFFRLAALIKDAAGN